MQNSSEEYNKNPTKQEDLEDRERLREEKVEEIDGEKGEDRERLKEKQIEKSDKERLREEEIEKSDGEEADEQTYSKKESISLKATSSTGEAIYIKATRS